MARRRRLQQLTLYRNPDDPGPPLREGVDYEVLEFAWSEIPTVMKQALADAQTETLAYVEEKIPLDKVRTPTAVGTDAHLQNRISTTLDTSGTLI
jgi:hypothetical protein